MPPARVVVGVVGVGVSVAQTPAQGAARARGGGGGVSGSNACSRCRPRAWWGWWEWGCQWLELLPEVLPARVVVVAQTSFRGATRARAVVVVAVVSVESLEGRNPAQRPHLISRTDVDFCQPGRHKTTPAPLHCTRIIPFKSPWPSSIKPMHLATSEQLSVVSGGQKPHSNAESRHMNPPCPSPTNPPPSDHNARPPCLIHAK
jgi:hypothetical protein